VSAGAGPFTPPRAHQVRYHVALAPCASGRDRVVPAAEGAMVKDVVQSNSSAQSSDGGSNGAADGGDGETPVARASSDFRVERSELLAHRRHGSGL
jgi:hypothetical protein